MFIQPKKNKDEVLYADVLSVSAFKPLAYMEYGEFEDKEIRPRCLAYVPRRILDGLLKKDDIYIITSKTEVLAGKTIECKNPPENDRLILTEHNESSGTHIFHLPSLLDLLQKNRGIVIRELNLDSISRNNSMPFKPPITKEITIEFVKLVSRKKQWSEDTQALVDVCFADPTFLRSNARDKIKLTKELEKMFEVIKDGKSEKRYKVIQKLALQLSHESSRKRSQASQIELADQERMQKLKTLFDLQFAADTHSDIMQIKKYFNDEKTMTAEIVVGSLIALRNKNISSQMVENLNVVIQEFMLYLQAKGVPSHLHDQLQQDWLKLYEGLERKAMNPPRQ